MEYLLMGFHYWAFLRFRSKIIFILLIEAEEVTLWYVRVLS